MNCANCSNEAIYVYEAPGVRKVVYCHTCLPSFLRPLAKSGLLPTTESFNTVKERVMTQLLPPATSDQSEEEIVAEAVFNTKTDETAVEDEVVEEAKPVRKRKRAVKPTAEAVEESEEV